MKNTIIKTTVKPLALMILAFMFATGAYGQDDQKLSKTEIRKLQREQRKAEQAAEMERMAELTNLMITHQQFVLEAEFLSDKYGTRIPVQSMINFVRVDSLDGVVQFGSAMSVGYNGVGGATLEGKISNYKFDRIGKKKDSFSLSMNFMSSLGTYTIMLMVNAEGYADATIQGNWSGSLNYHGRLVPITLSRIYKGHPTY
jgi:hypothetical protein